MNKAERIKNTLQETKERRKTQRPVVFQLKLQNLSKQRIEKLKRAFLEAKWFYNWLVSDLDRLNRPANKVGMVEVKVGNVFEDEEYFALALDGEKHTVDSITSNPAHGLLTGIIEEEKAEKLVKRLFSKDMFSGWGVRTMSNKMKAYNPFSYHNGSVWPHDNSLIIKGLLRYGYVEEARELARALLNAAEFFNYRLPELYSGSGGPHPLPYPVSCSPQLWAAGSAFVIADALEKY